MNTIIKFYIFLTFIVLGGSLKAQDLQGSYKGNLEVQGTQLLLNFNITKEAKGYSATLDVPAQGASEIPLDSVILQNNTVTITSGKLQMTYTGTLSGETIEGPLSRWDKNIH